MTLADRIRRCSLALAALLCAAALASPASAGNRNPAGGCDESQPRPKAGPRYENAAPANATSGARENTSLTPGLDDGYVPLSRTAPPVVAPAPRPADVAPARSSASKAAEKPATSARRAETPAPGPARAKKAAPAKVSIPNLPASPGMGTLLRVGIAAGQEIS